MRRSSYFSNYWARFRFKSPLPRLEGPAPPSAPQTMNLTRANSMVDTVNDSFPSSIRGRESLPDIPPDQFVDQFYFVHTTTPFNHEMTPWASSAPEGSFRFRPYPEFDKAGRDMVSKLRANSKGVPMRELKLAEMSGLVRSKLATPATIMDQAVMEQHCRISFVPAVEAERDVGRQENRKFPRASEGAGNFPFLWKTEDWYEYEVSKVRLKRFFYENESNFSEAASEITYKLVLGTHWEHHCKHLADDVSAFLRDIGRQIIEEKLNSVRSLILSYSSAPVIENTMRSAFGDGYDDEEIVQFIISDLKLLERQCVRILSLCHSFNSDFSDSSDPGEVWPSVGSLEPWTRMVEFWTQKSDTTFTSAEKSTRKYEFRKFFKVITIKMPFHSPDFERRLYDIRHWLHKRATIDFHTIYKKNIIVDESKFPIERDPVQSPSVADHRMYSFALDWQQAPADLVRWYTCEADQKWETIATRLGCSADELMKSNPEVDSPALGLKLIVPPSAHSRPLSTPRHINKFILPSAEHNTWESAAAAMGVTVEELQACNGEALARYQQDHFSPDTKELFCPIGASAPTFTDFATQEHTFRNDTFETIAKRLGTTVTSLRDCNPGVTDPRAVPYVQVPSDAQKKRRVMHPLARSASETSELFPSLQGTVAVRDLPPEFPVQPSVAEHYPAEFDDREGHYPATPHTLEGVESWLSYTATYLDKNLTVRGTPSPEYQLNPAWPELPVPGTQQQTPFEEDQTWLLANIPLQTTEMFNPKQHLQDQPRINNEHFAQSIELLRP